MLFSNQIYEEILLFLWDCLNASAKQNNMGIKF